MKKINEVKEIVKKENRFKKIIVTINELNKGLANSIIDGVTYVINSHGKVIVLEDDLILSPFFLSYMGKFLSATSFKKDSTQLMETLRLALN